MAKQEAPSRITYCGNRDLLRPQEARSALFGEVVTQDDLRDPQCDRWAVVAELMEIVRAVETQVAYGAAEQVPEPKSQSDRRAGVVERP